MRPACRLERRRADPAASPGLVRADAAYWPANGHVYVLGGRHRDTAGSFNDTIYSYNPATNAWATATGALTDTNTSNLAVAVLTGPTARASTPSAARSPAPASPPPASCASTTRPPGPSPTARPGPQNPAMLPGGWAVHNNKLYIFGGFDPVTGGGATPADIWIFDPATAGGTWTHSRRGAVAGPRL